MKYTHVMVQRQRQDTKTPGFLNVPGTGHGGVGDAERVAATPPHCGHSDASLMPRHIEKHRL